MANNQRRATGGDMIRSIAVIMVPVLIIMALLTQTPDEPEVPTVQWKPALADARAQAPFRVVAPKDLPEGPKQWRATQVHWSKPGEPGPFGKDPTPRHQWYLGMISPDTIHYALRQADGDQDAFIAETTRSARPVGESAIGAEKWIRLETEDGRTRAMARKGGTDVVVVTADTDFGHLDQFVRALSTD